MTTVLSPSPWMQFFDTNGLPLVNGRLFTYAAGTTTKIATYTDSTGGTPNTNPVVTDSRGQCNVWINPNTAYKYVLAPPGVDDPPTITIRTIDQIINSALISLYGGVDTGIVNAYILNFTAPYTAYADGEYIIWIPSHTNTGPSTVNVNGFGVINITNADGSVLSAGEIVANQPAQILIKGGAALLTTPAVLVSSTFTATSADIVGSPTITVYYTRVGQQVTLSSGTNIITGTSNAATFKLSGVPAIIIPVRFQIGPLLQNFTDNGTNTFASTQVNTDGTFQFLKGAAFTPYAPAWTAAGTKTSGQFTLSYLVS